MQGASNGLRSNAVEVNFGCESSNTGFVLSSCIILLE